MNVSTVASLMAWAAASMCSGLVFTSSCTFRPCACGALSNDLCMPALSEEWIAPGVPATPGDTSTRTRDRLLRFGLIVIGRLSYTLSGPSRNTWVSGMFTPAPVFTLFR